MIRKLIIVAAFVLACVSPSLGQHYIAPTIVNNLGQPVPNATIRVCTEPAVGYPCSNLATLYTCIAQNGSCPSPNPLTGDADGNFDFYATNTLIYHFEITGPSVVPYIQSYVYMPGPPGSSNVPGCGLYDVQLNYPAGTFGGDCGIFQENPSTHTAIDYIFSANQQLQVGDATHTGLLTVRHTNGTTNDANFIVGLSPTFSTTGGGYKIDIPDSPAIGYLNITSLTPGSDGRLPTAWSPVTVTAQISCENIPGLQSCNAPYPATTSDVTYTLYPQVTSSQFMGPPPGAGNEPYLGNPIICEDFSGTHSTATCTTAYMRAGDILPVVMTAPQGISIGTPTDTAGDAWHNAYTVGTTLAGYFVASTGGFQIVSITLGSDSNFMLGVGEIVGASTVDVISSEDAGCTGLNPNFAPITTTASDVILAIAWGGGIAHLGYTHYTAGSGYFFGPGSQLAYDGGGGLNPSMSVAMEFGPFPTPGTYTPSMTADANCIPNTISMAFKNPGTNAPEQPIFRFPWLTDLVAQGWLPPPVTGDYLSYTGTYPNGNLVWSAGIGSGVTAVTGLAPVASTGGTTPQISLQNSAAVNITSALGTGTAIMTASGPASTSGDVMEGDTFGGFKDSGTLLSSLAPLASPTFTGTVTIPALTLSGVTGTTQCLQANSSGVVSGTGLPCGASGGGLSITTPTPAGIVLSNGTTTSVYSQTNATIDTSGDALFNGTVTSGGAGPPYYDLMLGFNSSQPTGCGVAGTACIYTLAGSPNQLMAAVDGGTPFVIGSSSGGLITGTTSTNTVPKGGAVSGTLTTSSVVDNGTNVATTEPVLSGTDNSVAGIFQASNGSANAHTNWESGATTTNTIKGFATAPTTGDLVDCVTSGIVCLLTDSGVLAANVVKASSPGVGIAHFAGSTQTVTSSAVNLAGGSNEVTGILPNANLPSAVYDMTFPAIATAQTWATMAPTNATFPANFTGGAVSCGTNPSGTVTFTLTDVTTSTAIGTVQVSSSCVGTFATTGGTTQAVSAKDRITMVSGTDASALQVVIYLLATRN